MQKLTQEQALIITGYTGVMCIGFDTFHADVERRLKRPVQAYQFCHLRDEIEEAYKDDFFTMCPVPTGQPPF